MSRYIKDEDLSKLMYHEAFEVDSDMQKWDSGCWIRYKVFENCLKQTPTADVVEVVRCKNCQFAYWENGEPIWCNNFLYAINGNEFCSYGERREDGKIH